MLFRTSRYYNIETAQLQVSEEKTVVYLRRRFLPLSSSFEIQAEHTVTQNERLDNITAQYLVDPELFWLLCDANDAMLPEELTDEIGRRLKIPLPQ
jgi:hypothetical protein